MSKMISTLPLILLMGCSLTYPPSTNAQPPISKDPIEKQRDLFGSAIKRPGEGFDVVEAKQMLEFCIELNNQDDRLKHPDDGLYKAMPGNWQILFDSRNLTNTSWNTGSDPTKNGIEPFNNAWLLLKNGDNPKQYAIAIRGTVGEKFSLLDDALLTTIPAKNGIMAPDSKRLPIIFAATPNAEVHLGFANAAFVLLFDKKLGILAKINELKDKIPPDAQFFITGHSQGAAIATIVHSFLYYALADTSDLYKLKPLQINNASGIQLKSYVFAQPKPGNLQYAEDLAQIAKDQFYVINNHLDIVPQVPLSIQSPSEAIKAAVLDNAGVSRGMDLALKLLIKPIEDARNHFAEKGANDVAKLLRKKEVNLNLSYFLNTSPDPIQAHSQNYTLAGELIPVFGLVKGGCLYPMQGKDELIQHHATTYRILLKDQIEGIKTPNCTQ